MATVQYGTLQLVPAPQLGLAVHSNFFGADIRYSVSKTYSLKGTLINNQTDGVSGIFLQQNDIVTGFATDYQPFIVNGIILGYPKVNNISFDESTYLQKNGFTIELEIFDSGNPFQIMGLNYGFTGITGLFSNLQSLAESLNYNTDFRTYSYSHSVDILYRTGVNVDPLLNSKIIASGLLNNKTAFPFTISGGTFGNKTYEEKTDLINGSYSVTEGFIGSTGTGFYNHTFAVDVRIETNGITQVIQNGSIRGFGTDKYIAAKSGYQEVRNTIYDNCSGVYSRYLNGILNNTFLTDSRVDDILLGAITYSRSYNDSTGISDTRFTYTTQIELNGNKIEVVEVGQIVGLGHITVRFNQASGKWIQVQTGITPRCYEQYSGYGFTGILYPINREQSFDRYHGEIDYNYRFSNNNNFGLGSGIRTLETTIEDSLPVANHVNFNVVHQGVLIQNLNSTRQGERNVNVNVQAFRDTPVPNTFQFITDTLNKYRPTGIQFIDPFLQSLNLSQNPTTNLFSANAKYIYGGFKTASDLGI